MARAQQEALPGSPPFMLHLMLQSSQGWVKYLLCSFFFFPSKETKNKKLQKKKKRNLNPRRAISITACDYIEPFNCWLQSCFFNHVLQRKLQLFLPPMNTPNHHLFLHLQ